MNFDPTACLGFGALFTALGTLLGVVTLRRQIDQVRGEAKKHREVTAGLVDGLQGTRNRLTQVEKQLGRTMRHAGVPGLE